MKISFFLQNIFTHSYILQRNPNIQSQHQIYDIDIDSNVNANNVYKSDLPINYNTIEKMLLMSYDAYLEENDSKWREVEYNKTADISLDPNSVRGYLFSDETKTHNIIAIKGTSISFIPMVLSNLLASNSTVALDKFNDNLFFGCCFYKESSLFKNYCQDDITDKNQCSKQCYKDSTNIDLNYIKLFENIINNVKKIIDFDNSTMFGIIYDKQVITFNGPGGKHYLDLIGFDYKEKDSRVYHFGHTADSIMHGHCGNLCWSFGYNVETKCHIGNSCIYDSKAKLGISDSIRTHQMSYIINNILPHWKDDFPQCIYKETCEDSNCNNWTYI